MVYSTSSLWSSWNHVMQTCNSSRHPKNELSINASPFDWNCILLHLSPLTVIESHSISMFLPCVSFKVKGNEIFTRKRSSFPSLQIWQIFLWPEANFVGLECAIRKESVQGEGSSLDHDLDENNRLWCWIWYASWLNGWVKRFIIVIIILIFMIDEDKNLWIAILLKYLIYINEKCCWVKVIFCTYVIYGLCNSWLVLMDM